MNNIKRGALSESDENFVSKHHKVDIIPSTIRDVSGYSTRPIVRPNLKGFSQQKEVQRPLSMPIVIVDENAVKLGNNKHNNNNHHNNSGISTEYSQSTSFSLPPLISMDSNSTSGKSSQHIQKQTQQNSQKAIGLLSQKFQTTPQTLSLPSSANYSTNTNIHKQNTEESFTQISTPTQSSSSPPQTQSKNSSPLSRNPSPTQISPTQPNTTTPLQMKPSTQNLTPPQSSPSSSPSQIQQPQNHNHFSKERVLLQQNTVEIEDLKQKISQKDDELDVLRTDWILLTQQLQALQEKELEYTNIELQTQNNLSLSQKEKENLVTRITNLENEAESLRHTNEMMSKRITELEEKEVINNYMEVMRNQEAAAPAKCSYCGAEVGKEIEELSFDDSFESDEASFDNSNYDINIENLEPKKKVYHLQHELVRVWKALRVAKEKLSESEGT